MWIFAAQALVAMGPPPGSKQDPKAAMLWNVMLLVFMFVVMWLVMIRPQQKKAKEHALLMKSIKPGDKVLTSGGILGSVVAVKEKTVSIRSADTKIEVVKSAVSEVLERASGDGKSE
jgi:preprotein translocase subunit YajC